MKKAKYIGGAIFFGAIFLILATFVTMWLWNWLMPSIFNLGTITIWQAGGILILSKILFSGGCNSRSWYSNRKKKYWHSQMEEKWNKIPDEKKKKIIHKLKEKGFNKNSETEEQ